MTFIFIIWQNDHFKIGDVSTEYDNLDIYFRYILIYSEYVYWGVFVQINIWIGSLNKKIFLSSMGGPHNLSKIGKYDRS